jgi:hypothetical protein
VYACQPDERAMLIAQFGAFFLSNLDQWCTCVRGPNIPKWPAILSMDFTKSFLPLVKKLSIFEYK